MPVLIDRLQRQVGRVRHFATGGLLLVFPRSIWRCLPGSSERFGPPRRWQETSRAAHEGRIEWLQLFPASVGEHAQPFWPPPGALLPFRRGRRFSWPVQGVARIRRGRILTADGWCVAPGDMFLGDFSFEGRSRRCRVYHIAKLRSLHELRGVTLSLCSAYAAINYCHWLLDAVSRLALVEKAGLVLEAVDQILLPPFSSVTTQWVINTLGLPREKVVLAGRHDQYRCEVLLQPSFPGTAASYSPWAIEYFQRRFPPPAALRRRRIFIPRRGVRGLTNQLDVETTLKDFGFETFDPSYGVELQKVLADVSHVVAIHGAAMANLVFAPRGTRVLELMPSDNRSRFFYSMCSGAGMPYGVLVGRSTKEKRFDHVQANTNAPFTIDLEQLRHALSALCAPAEPPSQ